MSDPSSSTVLRYEPKPAQAVPEPLDRLKELIANGYVPEAGEPGEAGMLLRHRSAPDLIFHADGRIDVPIGQPAKRIRFGFDWRSWLRILALVVVGGLFWLASVGISLSILESL